MGPCIRLLLFTLLCFSFNPSFADEANDAPEKAEATPDTPNASILDERPPTLINMTALPSSIVNGSVNVITGDYLISDVDYTVAGPDPYVLGHSYSSSSLEPGSMGRGWNFHHQHMLEVYQQGGITYNKNKDGADCGGPIFTYLIEPFGGRIAFSCQCEDDHKIAKLTRFEAITKNTGFTNVIGSKISGQTNVKNIEIDHDRHEDLFTVTLGDGTVRVYERRWKTSEMKDLRPHFIKDHREYQIHKEILPSGNFYVYHYNKDHEITNITCYNKDRSHKLAEIDFERKDDVIHVKTSDKQEVTYSLKKLIKHSNRGKRAVEAITVPGHPTTHFEYSDKSDNYDRRVTKMSRDDGYYVQTKYYRNGPNKVDSRVVKPNGQKERHFLRNRVRKQAAPVGPGGQKVTTHRYFYYKRTDKSPAHCTVRDAYNNTARYYWNRSRRLIKIVKHDANKNLLKKETFTWGTGKQKGYLIARNLFDEENKPMLSRVFEYDSKGNIVTETLYGRFLRNTGDFKIIKGLPVAPPKYKTLCTKYTYSHDGLNLKTSICDPRGNYTYFDYYKGTNLIKAKFICDKDKIKKREFYEYDKNAILIEEITDDGTSRDKDDLKGITERHIKRIKPRHERPRFGEPEEIFEYCLFKGKEKLLRKTVNSYDALGFLSKKKLFDAKKKLISTTHYKHDDAGRLIYRKDALGNEEHFTYDKHGRLESKQGPRQDLIIHYEYDKAGHVIKETEEQTNGPSLTTNYEYDLLGRKIRTTDPQGHSTSYEYDALNRIIKISYPQIFDHEGKALSPTKKYTYKNLGTQVTEEDENGHCTTTIYSAAGKVFAKYMPDGTRWFYRYNKLGHVCREVTPTRVHRHLKYDFLGRVKLDVMYKGENCISRTKYFYNAYHLLQEISPTQEITRYRYDAAGRMRGKWYGKNEQMKCTKYLYDSFSRLAEERVFYGLSDTEYTATCFTYDALNHKVTEETKHANGLITTYKAYAYDEDGNVAEVTESIMGNMATTKTSYNPHRLIKEVIDAEGHITKCFYDYYFTNIHGQKVIKKSTVDARGCTHDEIYDARGNLHCTIDYDPFGNVIAKQELYYDSANNLIRTKDHAIINGKIDNFITNTFTYGPQNRLEEIIEALDTPEQKTTRYTYNPFGQKEKTIHADGTTLTNSYDDKGRVREFFAEDKSVHYGYEYDASDRILSVTNHLSNQKTERTYDNFGDLASETLESGLRLQFGYDRASRLAIVTLPDKTHVRYGYSPSFLHRVERLQANYEPLWQYEITSRDLSGHILSATLPKNAGSITYSYDMLGRRVETSHPTFKEEAARFDTIGNLLELKRDNKVNTYAYDYLSQLTEEKGHASHTYAYDSLYNRRSLDTSTYTVNSIHSVLSDGKRAFSYDKRANRIESDRTKYRYDAIDRLIEVKKDDKLYVYSYDAFDRRIQKEVFVKIGDGWKSEHIEMYIYHLQNEIGSCDIYGTIKELRILGEGLGAEIGATVAMELQEKLYVPMNDRRGNLAALLDPDTAQIVESYEYDAFGNEEINIQSHATNNPWRFASKRVDPETSLIYFGRRYYDPSLGKWLTHDPLGLKAGPNLYAYVFNNPLRKIDLYGLVDQENDYAQVDNNTTCEGYGGQDQRPDSSTHTDRHSRDENSSSIDYNTSSAATTDFEPSPLEDGEEDENSASQTVKEHILSTIINSIIRTVLGKLEQKLHLPPGMLTGSYGLMKAAQNKTSTYPKNKPKVASGQTSKTHQIQKDKQNKHVPGNHNYEHGKSVFEHKDPQGLVDKYAGTGKSMNSVTPGEPGYREKVNFNEHIGYFVDKDTQTPTATTWGTIHYAKDGVHIVPTLP